MNSSILWSRISLILLLVGVVILSFALTLQPKISDEWYLIWNFQDSGSPFNFMVFEYTHWMGRGRAILLASFVLPNPVVEIVYRAFISIEIVLLVVLAWYCALGPRAWRLTQENCQALAIFGCLLWFALPVRDETVAWLGGNFVCLLSALLGLGFMAWIEQSLTVSVVGLCQARWRIIAAGILSFLVGFTAGVSQEQVVAACVAYLFLIAHRLPSQRDLRWSKIGSNVWITVLGLVVGTAVLFFAPGNYARMAKIDNPSLFEIIERMILYVLGAFFEIGTGSTGKNIWLAALVFILLHFSVRDLPCDMTERLKRGGFWFFISFCSLLVMAPATNFLSPRTTFFAIIFLFIGFAAITYPSPVKVDNQLDPANTLTEQNQITSEWSFALNTFVLMILACLVIVEAVAGLISNAVVYREVAHRIEIVENAKFATVDSDSAPISVPFISTQPAALTYMQSPEHDREFLANWGRRIGRPIVHDVSEGARLPNSFKPLKAIKFRHTVPVD